MNLHEEPRLHAPSWNASHSLGFRDAPASPPEPLPLPLPLPSPLPLPLPSPLPLPLPRLFVASGKFPTSTSSAFSSALRPKRFFLNCAQPSHRVFSTLPKPRTAS